MLCLGNAGMNQPSLLQAESGVDADTGTAIIRTDISQRLGPVLGAG